MDSAKCRSCQNPIFWIKTRAGKNIPVDTTKITVVTMTGDVVSGYESHFATCPNASQHRKGG